MAIGALFAPKLAGKVHNLHYNTTKTDKMKTLQYFGHSVQWPLCIKYTCKRVRMFIVIIGLNIPDYSHLSNFASTASWQLIGRMKRTII